MQYDDMAGAASKDIEARIHELATTASTKNWRFPTPCWRCSTTPTRNFASALPHLQRVHRRTAGTFQRPLLRRRADQLVGSGGRAEDAGELKSLGLKTFLMPINPGKDDDGNMIDYGSALDAVWDEIEAAGLPVRTTSARPRRKPRASSTASSSE